MPTSRQRRRPPAANETAHSSAVSEGHGGAAFISRSCRGPCGYTAAAWTLSLRRLNPGHTALPGFINATARLWILHDNAGQKRNAFVDGLPLGGRDRLNRHIDDVHPRRLTIEGCRILRDRHETPVFLSSLSPLDGARPIRRSTLQAMLLNDRHGELRLTITVLGAGFNRSGLFRHRHVERGEQLSQWCRRHQGLAGGKTYACRRQNGECLSTS